jgi:hypothetical protein
MASSRSAARATNCYREGHWSRLSVTLSCSLKDRPTSVTVILGRVGANAAISALG